MCRIFIVVGFFSFSAKISRSCMIGHPVNCNKSLFFTLYCDYGSSFTLNLLENFVNFPRNLKKSYFVAISNEKKNRVIH